MANGFQGPPAVDFYSQLSGLGDVIAANRTAQAKRDAFAQATTPGADGQIDYGRAILGLAQVDPQAAALFASRQNHQDTLKQQGIDNARAVARDATADKHFGMSYSLQKRAADRADDPTPAGWVKDPNAPGGYRGIGPNDPANIEAAAAARARAAAGVPPDGFEPNPAAATDPTAPKYLPKSGGPQDPAYQARLAAETARAKGDVPTVMGPGSSIIVPNRASEGAIFTNKPPAGSSGLSPEALEIRARQWNRGDYEGATKNVGRGAQGGATLEAIANHAAKLLTEEGMTPDDAAAHVSNNMQKFKASGIYQNTEARTGASREANLNLILRATDAAIPAALEASKELPRGNFVPLTKLIQKGQVMTSNPQLLKFGMANLQLAEHWARAMNPTGVMRESDRDKALEYLSSAYGNGTYEQIVGQLQKQITRERDAVREGKTTLKADKPPVPGAAEPVKIDGYTITEH